MKSNENTISTFVDSERGRVEFLYWLQEFGNERIQRKAVDQLAQQALCDEFRRIKSGFHKQQSS